MIGPAGSNIFLPAATFFSFFCDCTAKTVVKTLSQLLHTLYVILYYITLWLFR